MEPMLPYDLEALRTSERHEGKDACKAGMHTTDPITPTSPDYLGSDVRHEDEQQEAGGSARPDGCTGTERGRRGPYLPRSRSERGKAEALVGLARNALGTS